MARWDGRALVRSRARAGLSEPAVSRSETPACEKKGKSKKGGQCWRYSTHCAWNFNGPLDLTTEDQRWLFIGARPVCCCQLGCLVCAQRKTTYSTWQRGIAACPTCGTVAGCGLYATASSQQWLAAVAKSCGSSLPDNPFSSS